jgi:uncharacterized Tic20 family protein
MSPGQARQIGMWAHLGGLLVFFIGGLLTCGLGTLLGWIVPLVILNGSGTRDAFVKAQATESLNFQINLIVHSLVLGFLGVITFGLLWVLLIPWWIAALVLNILGAVNAKGGQRWRYPVMIPFLRSGI